MWTKRYQQQVVNKEISITGEPYSFLLAIADSGKLSYRGYRWINKYKKRLDSLAKTLNKLGILREVKFFDDAIIAQLTPLGYEILNIGQYHLVYSVDRLLEIRKEREKVMREYAQRLENKTGKRVEIPDHF